MAVQRRQRRPRSKRKAGWFALPLAFSALAAALWYNGAAGATVTMTARDEAGNQLGTASFPMTPGTKLAFAVRDRIPAAAEKRGLLEFTTPSGTIAVLGLRFAGSAFTSIPAVQ